MLAPADILAAAGTLPEVPESTIEQTAALITGLGFRGPVVLDSSGRIVQGHARVLAAQRLGLSAIPVRRLRDEGAAALARGRAASRDPRAESSGVIGLSVWRPWIYTRHDASWIACRAWRWSTKAADLAAFRQAKRDGAEGVVEAAAAEIALLLRRLSGALPGWTVTCVPCGNSGTSECFSKRLGRAVGGALGLPFEEMFEDRLVEGGSSHPQRYSRLQPLEWRAKPAGPVLLVDDVATTGLHVAEALGALRGEGVTAIAAVWISGDVR